MFKRLGQLAVALFALGCVAQTSLAQEAVTGSVGSAPAQNQEGDLKSLKDKSSYLLGRQAAKPFLLFANLIDSKKFFEGFRDELNAKKNPIKQQEIRAVMMAFQGKVNETVTAISKANQKEGADFLAKNKSNKNVKILDNGIQYIELKPGTGAIPKQTDTVKVHYVGTFIDGKEFDSSVRRGEPATFPLQRVIRGWTTTVSRMKVGAKWRIFVPGNLAYGPQGRDGIPPNKLLVFEIELLDIIK